MTLALDERVARSPNRAVTLDGFRNQPPGFDPLAGEGARRAGGRCNPPGSFPVLYLCLSLACVRAELRRAAESQGLALDDLLPREVYRVEVQLDRVLDLRDPVTLTSLGVATTDLTGPDRRTCQDIGASAHGLGIQGSWLPSATGVGEVLAVFVRQLGNSKADAQLHATWNDPVDVDEGPRPHRRQPH